MDCTATPVCLELVKGLPTAVVALVVGGIAALIAFKQYGVARAKLKLDLFEKRFAVFAGTRLFLTEVMTAGRAELKTLFTFRGASAEASFLFGAELEDYLREIDRRALRMHILETKLKDTPVGDERNRLVDEEAAELTWLTDQLPVLKEKFVPYLGFATWR